MSSEVLEMYETLTDERRQEVNNFIQSLVAQQERLEQNAKEKKKIGSSFRDAFGCLSKYANPALWEKEEGAWAEAVAEKYALR